LILHDDASRKHINVHASLAKYIDSVMSIQYSSIRPCFQTTFQSRQQPDVQGLSGKPLHLREFGRIQRTIRVKRYQGRAFWRVRHFVRLLHQAPSRIVPQQRRGKKQRIEAVEHAAMAGKNRTGVFHPGSALDQRFHQIAKLRSNI
jgi:hypothetical protein